MIFRAGRKHGLYGKGLKEAAEIDMLADGVEDIKRKVTPSAVQAPAQPTPAVRDLYWLPALMLQTAAPCCCCYSLPLLIAMLLQYLSLIYTDQLVSVGCAAVGCCTRHCGPFRWCCCCTSLCRSAAPVLLDLTFSPLHAIDTRRVQAEEAKAAYWTAHFDPATTGGRNGGAHFAYLSHLVAKCGSGGWAVGGALSIADILLFDIVDVHQRAFGEDKFAAAYPNLAAVYKQVEAIPGVKAYLESPGRMVKVNNNGLG